jgi:hypothetical protein
MNIDNLLHNLYSYQCKNANDQIRLCIEKAFL